LGWAVLPNQLINTLGGGQLEFQAVKEALSILQAPPSTLDAPSIKRYPLGPSLGQCCGGVVHLAFEVVSAADAQALQKRLQTHEPHLALFGGGHVGRAIVALMEKLPWQVTWIDSRESIFPRKWARISNSSIRILCRRPWSSLVTRAHVLIMSFSHAEDLDVLQQCLLRQRKAKDLKSIGLIGSDTKWATFKSRLKMRGFEPEEFHAVQCPIGLAGLGAKEPEVIAISVVAKLLMNGSKACKLPLGFNC
jgi:xanthine dehydrogenase accessory factor